MITGRVAGLFSLFALLVIAFFYFIFSPSEKKIDHLALTATRFSALEGWDKDAQLEAFEAFKLSCKHIIKLPDKKSMGGNVVGLEDKEPMAGKVVDWRPSCKAALKNTFNDNKSARLFFQKWFLPVSVSNGDSRSVFSRGDDMGLFTGYYEPIVEGRKARGGLYQITLYKFPAHYTRLDLAKFRPSLKGQVLVVKIVNNQIEPAETRADIDRGALEKKVPAIFWLKDRIDAFFLHIQGSGLVELPDGRLERVGYDGTNGYEYYPIGRNLIERGEIPREKMSMQAIRRWLLEHPKEVETLLNKNQRYVFFRKYNGKSPFGSQGVPLTPGRSLAVDKRWIAMGIPIWLTTIDTDKNKKQNGPSIRRLMISQDTGAAIRGIVRGDIFFGAGAHAGQKAGSMNKLGRYFVLLPRALLLRRAEADLP